MTLHEKKQSNKPLYGIILTFIIPIILAQLLFHSGYGKKHHKSRGTLVAPPVKIMQQARSYWQIATLFSTEQDTQKLEIVRKRWIALGKDQSRVHLTILSDQNQTEQDNPWETIIVNNHIMQQLKEQLSKNKNACQLFIINPNNDAILCYDNDNDPKDIDLDLRKLLKLSRI